MIRRPCLAALWSKGKPHCGSFMNLSLSAAVLTLWRKARIEIGSEGLNTEDFIWTSKRLAHLVVFPGIWPFVFSWLKYKTICFKFHHRGGVGCSWLHYFYSMVSLAVHIDLIVVVTSLVGIIFRTGKFLRMWASIFVAFRILIFECLIWVLRATSKLWRQCDSIPIWLWPNALVMELCLFGNSDFHMLL